MRRPSFRAFRRVPAGALLAVLALAVLAPAPAEAQEVELRWKFNSGDEFVYEMVQESAFSAPGQGEMQQTQTMIYRQTVTDVDADGVATIDFVYERIMLDADAPDGTMSYDSDSEEPPADPSMAAMGSLVGQTFQLRVAPDGTVLSVTGAEGYLEEMTADLPPEVAQMMGDTFGEDALVDMMQQAFQAFPDESLSEGSTWDNETSVSLPFGTIASTYNYTLEALSYERGREVARISVDGRSGELQMDPDDPMAGVIQSTGGPISGMMVFDLELGQVLEAEVESAVNLSAMGQQITTTSIMRLRLMDH
ncbi:MAG: hypothetical protein EA352_11550 [Gemmatimonadales bacterium]|nr:MAG: hypothetical protein EA352_11550 [Gemmatimonadales bacterium]